MVAWCRIFSYDLRQLLALAWDATPGVLPGKPGWQIRRMKNLNLTITATLAALSIVTTQAGVTINPSEGYTITKNGTDGAFFNQTVPNNLALAANGAVAISSGDLGPQLPVPYHITANINDGFYGNNASWIGGEGNAAPWYAGVLFPGMVEITSIAFGRDNGDLTGENYQLTDRCDGTYNLQYTTDGGASWFSIGSLTYDQSSGSDTAPGGLFTSYLRNEYLVGASYLGAILANGLRVEVPSTGMGGNAIDELEVYGSVVPVPEPATGALAALAIGAWCLSRRRDQGVR